MKSLMFFLALGLVSSEKLDRSYLPPPGSKYSGGSPGDLQVPLELPKETYTTTAPFTHGQEHTGLISSEDKKITAGIDRGTAVPIIRGQSQDVTPISQTYKSPFNSFQSTYKVPTTTTSYAFTQTTTLAPVADIGNFSFVPLVPEIPNGGIVGQYPDLVGLPQPNFQGQFNQQIGQSQPGVFQPGSHIAPTPGSVISGYHSTIPSTPFSDKTSPFNFKQQGIPSSTVSPIPDSSIHPGFTPSQNLGHTQYLGVQPLNQQVTFASTTAAPVHLPGTISSQYNDQIRYNQAIFPPGSKLPLKPSQNIIEGPYSTPGIFQPGITKYVDKYDNVQHVVPGSTTTQGKANQPQLYPPTANPPGTGSIVPQQFPELPGQQGSFPEITGQGYSYYPGAKHIENLNIVPEPLLPGSRLPQIIPSQLPISGTQQNLGQYSQNQITDSRFPSQQVIQPVGQGVIGGGSQYGYGPVEKVPTSVIPSSINQQRFPSSTPSSLTYSTTPVSTISSTSAYSSSVIQDGVSPIRPSPDRPQADSDRNAVILNYETVLTPDGYTYNFDTSNGIHGDENGTTIDGVRANGSYSYIGDDGKLYKVVYTADENGFQPHGDHIPTPPPVPEAIQRVIEQAEKDREAGISHDGFYDEARYGHKKYQGPKHRPRIHEGITKIKDSAPIPVDEASRVDEKGNINRYGSYESRRPAAIENGDSLEDESHILIEDQKVKDGKHRKRPHTKMPARRPSETEPDDYEYIEEDTSVDDKRKPTSSKNYVRNEITSNRKYHSQPKNPGRKQKPSQTRYSGSENEYEENEYLEQEPDNYNRDDKLSSKFSGSKYESPADSAKPHSTRRPGLLGPHYDRDTEVTEFRHGMNRKPQKQMRGPSKTYGRKYSVSEYNEDNYYQKPQEDKVQKHGQTKTGTLKGYKRPSSETQRKQANKRLELESRDERDSDSDGVRFEQNSRPTHLQNGQVGGSKFPQQLNDKTGYRYLPPKNKLGQKETTRFPSRISEDGQHKTFSTTYEPDSAGTTPFPFITSNVYSDEDTSDEDGSEEKVSQRKPTKKPVKVISTITSSEDEFDTDSDSEFYDEDTDLDIGDEEITTTKVRPGKIGSTHRPSSQTQHATGNAQDDDQYTETDEDITVQKRPLRPGPKGVDRYHEDQKSKGRPGQDYTQRTPGRTKSSDYNFVSSTTPMPKGGTSRITSKKPGYSSKEGQSKYTYESSDTSDFDDNDSEGPTGLTQTTSSISRRPTKPQSVIETTSPTSLSTISGSSVSSSRPTPSTTPVVPVLRGSLTSEYPGITVTESITSRPGATSRIQGKPEIQDLPSTTYRPNYRLNDIIQPATVDNFGRFIITQPGDVLPGTTQIPEVTGTTIEGTGSSRTPGVTGADGTGFPSASVNQDSQTIKSGQPQDQATFKPGETRFGQPDFVPHQGSTSVPSSKPAEFGPSSITTPEYLVPYSSTGKVKGEDFSGPRQPQRYDPQTGYHYKK